MPTPVVILTGFLGSGKTTLLNRALTGAAMSRTAVIVNEFGEIGIDHDLVETSNDDVVLLANGCVCCAVKGDLVNALDMLYRYRLKAELPDLDCVVIETSGLAEPTPVIEVLLGEPTIAARYALAGVVTTVDAVCGAATLKAHLESAKQVAIADRIVVTKIDIAAAGAADALLMDLRALNRSAPVLDAQSLSWPGEWLAFGPEDTHPWRYAERIAASSPSREYNGRWQPIHAPHAPHADDPRIRSFTFVRDEPVPMAMLERFLDALGDTLGPELLRVKGLVHVAEHPQGPAVVHGAQQLLHRLAWLDDWPSADRRTRIVFIALESAADQVEELFEAIRRMVRRR